MLVRGFRGCRGLVIGDVMLAVFERAQATRLAPDTPAPVVGLVPERHRLGPHLPLLDIGLQRPAEDDLDLLEGSTRR